MILFVFYSELEQAWYGFTDKVQDGTWKWINPAGACNKYVRWNSGQPDGKTKEDCAALLKDGNWHDMDCKQKYASLVEVGATAAQLCTTAGQPKMDIKGTNITSI